MRWIFRLLGLVVVLVAVAIGTLFLIPTDRIGAIVGDQFERATGRTMSISGDIRPSLYPTLGVRADGVEVGNPAWVEDGPMLRAERLNIGVDLWALLSGSVRVRRFELVRPEIVLVSRADGVVSWDFSDGQGGAAPQDETAETGDSGLGGFSLDVAQISGGSLRFRDLAAGTDMRAEDLSLTLRLPSADGPARLEGRGDLNGTALSVEAVIEGVGPLLEGEVRPVTVSLDWAGGRPGLTGVLGCHRSGWRALSPWMPPIWRRSWRWRARPRLTCRVVWGETGWPSRVSSRSPRKGRRICERRGSPSTTMRWRAIST